jgi:hypothetical protein
MPVIFIGFGYTIQYFPEEFVIGITLLTHNCQQCGSTKV